MGEKRKKNEIREDRKYTKTGSNILYLEIEKLLHIAEKQNDEIGKKDELIFGLFEQVDYLKDNVEILQEVNTTLNL